MNDILPCFPILQYELNTLSFKAFSRLCWRFLYQIASFLVQFPEQEFMNAYNFNKYCVTYGSGDFGCNLNKILVQQIEVHDNKRLPYKLPFCRVPERFLLSVRTNSKTDNFVY